MNCSLWKFSYVSVWWCSLPSLNLTQLSWLVLCSTLSVFCTPHFLFAGCLVVSLRVCMACYSCGNWRVKCVWVSVSVRGGQLDEWWVEGVVKGRGRAGRVISWREGGGFLELGEGSGSAWLACCGCCSHSPSCGLQCFGPKLSSAVKVYAEAPCYVTLGRPAGCVVGPQRFILK